MDENKIKEKIIKIMNAIKDNFEGMHYDEIIRESYIDSELKDFNAFYAAIEYDITKILRM